MVLDETVTVRTPWIAPAVQVIVAGEAEVGFGTGPDGGFTTS